MGHEPIVPGAARELLEDNAPWSWARARGSPLSTHKRCYPWHIFLPTTVEKNRTVQSN